MDITNEALQPRAVMMQQLEQQRRCDDPPFVRDTFRRLGDAGQDEDAILEMCVWVLAAEYYRMLVLEQGWDDQRYGRNLNRLPVMPWEDDGSGYPIDFTKENLRKAILENPNLIMEKSEQAEERYVRLRSELQSIQKKMSGLIDPDQLDRQRPVSRHNERQRCGDGFRRHSQRRDRSLRVRKS